MRNAWWSESIKSQVYGRMSTWDREILFARRKWIVGNLLCSFLFYTPHLHHSYGKASNISSSLNQAVLLLMESNLRSICLSEELVEKLFAWQPALPFPPVHLPSTNRLQSKEIVTSNVLLLYRRSMKDIIQHECWVSETFSPRVHLTLLL